MPMDNILLPHDIFDHANFYAFPQSLLEQTTQWSQLDTLDILAFHTDIDGYSINLEQRRRYHTEEERSKAWYELGAEAKVRFDSYPEQWWFEADTYRRLKPLLTRQTYAKHKQRLIEIRAVTNEGIDPLIDPPIKFRFTIPINFPQLTIYRRRGYLYNRWPVWLGRNWLSRAIVLAFLDEAVSLALNTNRVPTSCELSTEQIVTILRAHYNRDDFDNKEIEKALQQLRMLGAIESVENADSTQKPSHRCVLTVFDARPQWSQKEILAHFTASTADETPWLPEFIALLNLCCQPVDETKSVWATLVHEYIEPGVIKLDDIDLPHLRSFIYAQIRYLRHQRRSYFPSADDVLSTFERTRLHRKRRLVSNQFHLKLSEISIVRDIRMPYLHAHYLNATQLKLSYSVAESDIAILKETLRNSTFYVWQDTKLGEPVLIPIPMQLPKSLENRNPLILRCNHLHGKIDYSRPFDLLLRCDLPNPEIQLTGHFNLLRAYRVPAN